MIEARKCVRCGSMYVSDTEVCGRCLQRDGVDLYKLKTFIQKQGVRGINTRGAFNCNWNFE